ITIVSSMLLIDTRIEHSPVVERDADRLHDAVSESLHRDGGAARSLRILDQQHRHQRHRASPVVDHLFILRVLANDPRPPRTLVADLAAIFLMQWTDHACIGVGNLSHQFLLAIMILQYWMSMVIGWL